MSKGDTDVQQFIEDLEAGVFMERVGHVLSKVAANVLDLEKVGEVTIKLKLKHMGARDQIMVEHDLSYKRPMMNGTMTENITGKTPQYVGTGGAMTLYPEKQEDAFFADEKRPQPSKAESKPVVTPSLVGFPGAKQ